jgi:hypothetical protein
MIRWNAAIFALLITCASMAGCSSMPALPARMEASPKPAAAAPQKQPGTFPKPSPRESALSIFSNPDLGVAFRYPRNFALVELSDVKEGASQDNSGARSQEELQSEEPGGVLVATVMVPDDAYPNTSFAGGSLQFAVNRYLTAGTCQQNLISRIGDSASRTGTAIIQGVEFAWADNDEGDADTEFFERDYAGFTNGTCYEFFLRAGVSSDSGGSRAPDDKKILGHLEKIVSSLQFESKPVSSLDAPPSGQLPRRKQ